MGSTGSTIMRTIFKTEDVRLLMLGLDAAGKTTMLYKMRLGEIVTTNPTIGLNVETAEYAKGRQVVSFTAWDLGGRCPIRPLWRHYYKGTNMLVFVVDSNDRDRFTDVRDELGRLLDEELLQDVPLLVYANKQDLPGAMPPVELAQELGLHRIRGRFWHIQGSCATTGDGLYEGLDALVHARQNKLCAPSCATVGAPAEKGDASHCEGSVSDTASTADTDGWTDEDPLPA